MSRRGVDNASDLSSESRQLERTNYLPSIKEPREYQLEKWKTYPRLTPSKYANIPEEANPRRGSSVLSEMTTTPPGPSSALPPLKDKPTPSNKLTQTKAQEEDLPEQQKVQKDAASPHQRRPDDKDPSVPHIAEMRPLVRIPSRSAEPVSKISWEIFLYLIFLVLVCIIAFGMINPIMYYYSHVLNKLFNAEGFRNESIAFNEVKSVPQFWTFAKHTLLPILFMDFDTEKGLNHFDDKLSILESMMVGQARLRQVRVRNDSCNVPKGFERLFKSCYGYYTSSNEDKTAFGKQSGTAWEYNEESELKSQSYEGRISTYGGGGYYVDLYKNFEESNRSVYDLWNNTWIDRGTRAVFIDFATYSPNVNLFCVVKLVAELPPTGGVVTESHFITVKLIRYLNVGDYVILACEVIFLIMVLYYTLDKCYEIFKKGRKLFTTWWNLVEIMILALSNVLIGLAVYLAITASSELDDAVLAMDSEDHYSFDKLVQLYTIFHAVLGVLVFLVWIKLFKYMGLSKATHHLQLTFAKCFTQLLGIAIAALIFMFAFAQLGHILFGMEVEDFSTLGRSLVTLLLILVGYFDYQKIEEEHRILGAFYLLIYIIFVPLLLISMIIAAVVFTYTEVGRSVYQKGNELYLVDIIKIFYSKMVAKCCRKGKEKQPEIEREKNMYERKYKNITDLLWRAGFTEEEITVFLHEYHISRDRPIEDSQVERMAGEIDRRRAYMKKKRYKEVMEELKKLSEKVNNMNEAIRQSDERLNFIIDLLLVENERTN